jgi:Protein of unknown function (DUF2817)
MSESHFHHYRDRFTQAVESQGGRVEEVPLKAAKGPRGERLTFQYALFHPPNPRACLLHIAGTHGVEGFIGSDIQHHIITSEDLASSCSILFIHGLNPYGMAHLRRVNEDNIDVNRNFSLTPVYSGSAPSTYAELNHFLNPALSPRRISLFYLQALGVVATCGFQKVKEAILHGQHAFPEGLYFGGHKESESITFLKKLVTQELPVDIPLLGIDVHSGLGASGKETLFFDVPDDCSKELEVRRSIEYIGSKKGIGYATSGELQSGIRAVCSGRNVSWCIQEFGAYSPLVTLKALRDEGAYVRSGGSDVHHWSKRRLLEVFYPSSVSWRANAIWRGTELFRIMKQYGESQVPPEPS